MSLKISPGLYKMKMIVHSLNEQCLNNDGKDAIMNIKRIEKLHIVILENYLTRFIRKQIFVKT